MKIMPLYGAKRSFFGIKTFVKMQNNSLQKFDNPGHQFQNRLFQKMRERTPLSKRPSLSNKP
jgi:hypothetical protein